MVSETCPGGVVFSVSSLVWWNSVDVVGPGDVSSLNSNKGNLWSGLMSVCLINPSIRTAKYRAMNASETNTDHGVHMSKSQTRPTGFQ